jgi:hypothetical protein
MQHKFRRMVDKKNGKIIPKRKEITNVPSPPQPQLRKKNRLLGVLRERFYPAGEGNPAALMEALTRLADDALDEDEASARERVFAAHRDAIQTLFNRSLAAASSSGGGGRGMFLFLVPGFLDSAEHCRVHFEHLSGAVSLADNVVAELDNQLVLVKKVLYVWSRQGPIVFSQNRTPPAPDIVYVVSPSASVLYH